MSESELLPTVGADGVYRYPDGSSVVQVCNGYYARDVNGSAIHMDGTPLVFGDKESAARALLEIFQGPASQKAKADNVNHPAHYTAGKVECIDAIESAVTELPGIEAHLTATAIAYLWRWKRKGGVEDLQKAKWYIDRLIVQQQARV